MTCSLGATWNVIEVEHSTERERQVPIRFGERQIAAGVVDNRQLNDLAAAERRLRVARR